MADIVDQSHDIEQAFFRSALTTKRPEGPPPKGCCYACDAPLNNDQRFCDADCRDDYQAEQRRNQQA